MKTISKTRHIISTLLIAFTIAVCTMAATSVYAGQNTAKASCTHSPLDKVPGTYTGTCKVNGCNSSVYVYKCHYDCGYLVLKCSDHHIN